VTQGHNLVRDGTATVPCPVCGTAFVTSGRRRHCSTACRQTAWRRLHAAPAQPVVAKSDTVYVCPSCDARYLGVFSSLPGPVTRLTLDFLSRSKGFSL
jgi:hypothetical protein